MIFLLNHHLLSLLTMDMQQGSPRNGPGGTFATSPGPPSAVHGRSPEHVTETNVQQSIEYHQSWGNSPETTTKLSDLTEKHDHVVAMFRGTGWEGPSKQRFGVSWRVWTSVLSWGNSCGHRSSRCSLTAGSFEGDEQLSLELRVLPKASPVQGTH